MTPELASRYQLSGYKHEATNNLVPFSIMANQCPFLILDAVKHCRIIIEGSGDSGFLPLWKILSNKSLSYVCVSNQANA